MGYATVAWERAMRMQDAILRAISGGDSLVNAADISGMTPRDDRSRGRAGVFPEPRGKPLRRRRHRATRSGLSGLED